MLRPIRLIIVSSVVMTTIVMRHSKARIEQISEEAFLFIQVLSQRAVCTALN